jgi:phage tail P2-like protein
MQLNNLSIINILPPYLAQDKATRMALQGFDEELRKAVAKIANIAILPNINSLVDNLLLDLLAWQFHVDFYNPAMAINLKRQLITRSLEWHTRKGTKTAVEEVVKATLSDAKITEWWEDETGTLNPYTFSIETNLNTSDAKAIEDLYRVIFAMKNTRSWIDAVTRLLNIMANYYVGIGLVTESYSLIKNDITPRVEPARAYALAYPQWYGDFTIKASEETI